MKWLTAVLLSVAAVLAGLLLYRTFSPAPLGGEALDAHPLPALPLVNEQGQRTSLNAADGRLRLVFYGYVRCPDVCPATLTGLNTIYAGLSPDMQRRVQVQFITVDPEHDTPAVVRAYLAKFNPTFGGLTGPAMTINAAARQMFVANVQPLEEVSSAGHGDHDRSHPTGDGHESGPNHRDQATSAQEAARLHGDQVSVVDGQGRFVHLYGNEDVIGGVLARDLPQLVRRYAN
ncbi:SCO family protein [Deinococcus navajonensis]|uniref:SCO family protein n=1 Tax=Deinococcus navajonensis TaxID=309884 RepID=A0ABV8XG74_9DEIO